MVQTSYALKGIPKLILGLFSFFLAFGKYDPFHTNGLYLDGLTLLALFAIFNSTSNINKILLDGRGKQFMQLICIALLLFFAAVLYGISYSPDIPLNLKYISATVLFLFLSYQFSVDEDLRYRSLFLFGLGCGVLALGYKLGVFNAQMEFNKGRLLIFGENPNSISSRMAAGFIIIYYLILEDPLKFGKLRFLLSIFLIPIFLFIVDTGSRGSILILGLAFFLLTLISKISLVIKVLIGLILFGLSSYMFLAIENSALLTRFQDEELAGSRERIWSLIFEIVQNNIWGVGEEGYLLELAKLTDRVQDAHNLYLYLLVCGGGVSIFIFLLFLISLAKKSISELKRRNVLPFIFLVFFLFLMGKTGGILTYLVMWYFLAYINSYSSKLNYK